MMSGREVNNGGNTCKLISGLSERECDQESEREGEVEREGDRERENRTAEMEWI